MDFDSKDTQTAFLDLVRKFADELKSAPGSVPNSLSDSVPDTKVRSIEADVQTDSFEIPFNGSQTLENPPLNSGDIPAVQERFHTLLKNRLSLEIEQNPPLFPWEEQILDYASDSPAESAGVAKFKSANGLDGSMSSSSLWLAQLRRLMTPVALPDALLGQFLGTCESFAQSSLLEGAKLVKVVESFFPDRFLQLNQLAGVVLMSPVRDSYTTLQSRLGELGPELPETYEAANETQQMVLSLLAARELLAALTIPAIPNQIYNHQWMTEIGALTLQVEYRVTPEVTALRIQGQLPSGGALILMNDAGLRASAQRPEAGLLSVELADLLPQQRLSLIVQLGHDDRLVFTIQP